MSDDHWKHVWPCSEILGRFVSSNWQVFRNSYILELGAGATGIPGIVAAKSGAKKVILTDHPDRVKALELLKNNCVMNDLPNMSYTVLGLDWGGGDCFENCLKEFSELNFVFAADTFYDPSVFEVIIGALCKVFSHFPNALCIFTYEERDCDWNIEDLLILNNLCCTQIRSVDTELHTIHIGIIFTKQAFEMSSTLFAGIEGGATHSKLVIVDETGRRYGEWVNKGTNYYLEGYEKVADLVATWVREAKKEIGVVGPLAALGIGTSGAEDETINERLCALLKEEHGDVASEYFVGSDSVVTIGATFDKGGVILIAGTGSSCRLLKADGSVHGVGGWGHMFSDGGSGFWIANRIFRYIFEDDDGLNQAPASTELVKQLLLKHFKLSNLIGVLDLLYAKFEKAYIASFSGMLAKEGRDDPLVQIVFQEAGQSLGEHLAAISKHFDEEMFEAVPVVAVGSLFKSWDLMRDGFINAVKTRSGKIRSIVMHKLEESPALGAAALAAKKINKIIHQKQSSSVFDVLTM